MDFEYKGFWYRAGRLNAFDQFHVARRLAPIQVALGDSLSKMAAQAATITTDEFMVVLAGPVTQIVAQMREEDVNYVLYRCMAVVQRKEADGRYAPVMVNQQLMFQDIDMHAMLRFTIEVIRENLTDFFFPQGDDSGSPTASPGQGSPSS